MRLPFVGHILVLGQSGGGGRGGFSIGKWLADKAVQGGWYPLLVIGGVLTLLLLGIGVYKLYRLLEGR